MGISTVIMFLGVSAFILVRNQYLLDAKVEATVTAIREAQNRSIAATKVNNINPKAWGVSFKKTPPAQITLYYTDGTTKNLFENVLEDSSQISISQMNPDFGSDTGNIVFTSPFGNSYLLSGGCNLVLSNKPTKEYIPDTSCVLYNEISVTLSLGNQSQTIIINRRGDVTISK